MNEKEKKKIMKPEEEFSIEHCPAAAGSCAVEALFGRLTNATNCCG